MEISDNLQPIPIPQGRDGVTGEWAARLTRRVNELRVMFGKGFHILSRGPDGTRVQCTAVAQEQAAGNGLTPWKIRRHKVESNVQWEIYIPFGCMSVGQTLEALNPAASEGKSGHEDDPPGWCIFRLPEMEGPATRESTDRDGNTTEIWDYSIIAHAKTSAKVDGVDALDAPARRLLWIDARKLPASSENPTDEDRAKGTWGDEFSQVVGTVEVSKKNGEEDAKPSFKITQLANAPISVQGRERAGFDLVWYFDEVETTGNDAGKLTVNKVYCVRLSVSAAGMTLVGEDMTDVTDAQETIYAKLTSNPLDPENKTAVEVVKDPEGMSTGNYLTWLQLYTIKYNAVQYDWRRQSLDNIQVYRR